MSWTRGSLNLNYTLTESELVQAGVKNGELSEMAKHVTNAQLRWDATEKLDPRLRSEYLGDSRRFDGNPDLLAGNNLLDDDFRGFLPSERTVWVSANANF